MKIGFAIFVAAAIAVATMSVFDATAQAQGFQVCKGKFALCTVAPCVPIPGNDKQVSCRCTVNTGYSVGQQACQDAKETPEGQQIRSRYFPVKNYTVCSNDRPWAWCLDRPCIISKNNPEAASCACDLVKGRGDYVTCFDPATTCMSGVISSATVTQITQVTNFLKTQSKLPPSKIQVLNAHH
ncbi:MAG: hypothetical protein ACREQR_16565 [Candidatus Binataceae bacterium]